MKRFVADLSYTSVSQIISVVCLLAIQIYTVRLLSIEQYGQYISLQTYVVLVETIFLARSGELALQYIGKFWNNDVSKVWFYRHALIKLDIKVNLIIYLATITLGFFLSNWLNIKWYWVVLLALMIPAQIGYGMWRSAFTINHKLKEQAQFQIIYSFINFLLAIIFVSYYQIEGLIIAAIVASLLKNIMAYQFTKKYWPKFANFNLHKISNKQPVPKISFYKDNFYSVLRGFFRNGAMRADLMLIAFLQSSENVALYKIAKTIANFPIQGSALIWMAIYPRFLSAFKSKNIAQLKKLLIQPALAIALIGSVVVYLLFLYGEVLISTFFGSNYQESIHPTLWLIFGVLIFNAVTGWLNFICIIHPQKKLGVMIYFFWLMIVIVAALLFAQDSIISMAIVVSGSMILTALLSWIYFMRTNVWLVGKDL